MQARFQFLGVALIALVASNASAQQAGSFVPTGGYAITPEQAQQIMAAGRQDAQLAAANPSYGQMAGPNGQSFVPQEGIPTPAYQYPQTYGSMGSMPANMISTPQNVFVGYNVAPGAPVPDAQSRNVEMAPPPAPNSSTGPQPYNAMPQAIAPSPLMMGGGMNGAPPVYTPGCMTGGDGPVMYDGVSEMPGGYPGMDDGYGACAGGCGPFPDCGPTPPSCYFRGEAVWLMRDRPNDRNLTVDTSTSASKFVLSTNDINFDNVAGMRLTLGYHLNDSMAIEGGFYGANRWDQSASTSVFQNGTVPGPLFPYYGLNSTIAGSNQQVATDVSNFNSAELGIRRWMSPTTSVLFGFRYMNVFDKFNLNTFNVSTGTPTSSAGSYQTEATNNLFGGQVGMEYTHSLYCNWLFFSLEGKGGVFLNWATQSDVLDTTSMAAGVTGDVTTHRSSGIQFSPMADVSFALTALVSNHLTIRGGYTFLFLDGVALAPDQLDMNPLANNANNFIADKGSITLQGPFVGGELAW